MGWGRTLLLGDIGNRLDMEDVESKVVTIRDEIQGLLANDESQDKLIERLINENGQFKLYLTSIFRLLIAKKIVSQAELNELVMAIDAEDGIRDGKLT